MTVDDIYCPSERKNFTVEGRLLTTQHNRFYDMAVRRDVEVVLEDILFRTTPARFRKHLQSYGLREIFDGFSVHFVVLDCMNAERRWEFVNECYSNAEMLFGGAE